MIFLPLPFLLAEFFLFLWLSGIYGFFPVLGAYVAPSFLGLFILSFQSRTALNNLQQQVQRGRDPGSQAIAAFAKFAAGILFVVPFFSTRILGLILLLPGTRQLLLFVAQSWITKKMKQAKFRVFTNVRGAPGGFYAGPDFRGTDFGRPGFSGEAQRPERDVTVIDVMPIEIEPPSPK
jgi:UPF0716 protein FxsA